MPTVRIAIACTHTCSNYCRHHCRIQGGRGMTVEKAKIEWNDELPQSRSRWPAEKWNDGLPQSRSKSTSEPLFPLRRVPYPGLLRDTYFPLSGSADHWDLLLVRTGKKIDKYAHCQDCNRVYSRSNYCRHLCLIEGGKGMTVEKAKLEWNDELPQSRRRPFSASSSASPVPAKFEWNNPLPYWFLPFEFTTRARFHCNATYQVYNELLHVFI
jgi:hypothetical protein